MDCIEKREVKESKITLEVVTTRLVIETTVMAVIIAKKVKRKRISYLRKRHSLVLKI